MRNKKFFPILVVVFVFIVGLLLLAIANADKFAKSNRNDYNIKVIEEGTLPSETSKESEATKLTVEVTIPENTTVKTEETSEPNSSEVTETEEIVETSFADSSIPDTAILDIYDKELEVVPIHFAENNAVPKVDHIFNMVTGTIVTSFADPRNPNVVFIEVPVDHSCEKITYQSYDSGEFETIGIYLEGITIPNYESNFSDTGEVPIENASYSISVHNLLVSLFRYFTVYIESDFIPDENGYIHGYLYGSKNIINTPNAPAYSSGQEAILRDLCQINEWLLALEMARIDTSYDGIYKDIYSQYEGYADDLDNYPLFIQPYWENNEYYAYIYHPEETDLWARSSDTYDSYEYFLSDKANIIR